MTSREEAIGQSLQEGGRLFERLKLWTDRLVRIRLLKADYCCQLAEMGVLANVPPAMHSSDRPGVVKLKEKLLAMSGETEAIRREMTKIGAEIFDEKTMEILFPGGPVPESFLSWMPGEPRITWWRAQKDIASLRKRLPGICGTDGDPIPH